MYKNNIMEHTFTTKQIMNITTGRLYTNMLDIYDIFDKLIGEGIMTHMLPNAAKAIYPILKDTLKEYPHLFTNEYNPKIDNPNITFEFTEKNKSDFWETYMNIILSKDSPIGLN